MFSIAHVRQLFPGRFAEQEKMKDDSSCVSAKLVYEASVVSGGALASWYDGFWWDWSGAAGRLRGHREAGSGGFADDNDTERAAIR